MDDKERDKVEGECAEALKVDRDVVEDFEERAAIMEYDGNMPREDAEREAVKDVLKNVPDYKVQVELLKAHLVSKGYGHAAIKRILKGEVVG